MKKATKFLVSGILFMTVISLSSCDERPKPEMLKEKSETIEASKHETPNYFLLRPEVEKAYGYSHVFKIGNSIKISGIVSMDDEGNPSALITGTSKRIGLETAMEIGRAGYKVFATMHNPDGAADLKQIIKNEELDISISKMVAR